jgi:hypothetical protein
MLTKAEILLILERLSEVTVVGPSDQFRFLDSVPSFEGMDNHGVYMWKQNGGPNRQSLAEGRSS